MKRWKQRIIDKKTIDFLNKYSPVFHLLLSCVICFFIEAVSRHSVRKAFDFFINSTWVFFYNASIIFATLLIVYLFKRRTLMRCLISCAWILLGIINGCLLLKRVTPFGFTDLKMIKDLLAMKNNYFTGAEAGAAFIGIVFFILFNIWVFKKAPKFTGKRNFFMSAAMVASCFIWVPVVTDAAVNSNLLTDYFGNIAQGYEKYGFVYGFSSSVVDRGMQQPENYVEEEIHRIQDSIQTPETNRKGKEPNIIVVLLESFIDPQEISFLQCSKDPVPNFRRLTQEYSSGYLNVPVVGAGTANTEFEILTGMSMRYFGAGEYPYKTALKQKTCESIASDLRKLGYGTHVIHNNGGNFYSRANAFKQMGFDTFTSKELMNIQSYTPLNTWAKDDILLEEIEKTMDSTKDSSDFIYTITVQAHGDYPREQVLADPEIKVGGARRDDGTVDEGMNYAWEYYINQLHEVDAFIGNLIKQLEERKEDTMVVFFGDHLPTMGLKDQDMKSGDLFKTRYTTWNNFGLSKEDAELSSYNLIAEMTGRMGIHEGTMFTYHQSERAKSRDENFIRDLELLQYDILYGKRYAYHGLDLYPASDLKMGVREVTIKKVEDTYDKRLYVLGSNFTPWSKVYINGAKKDTVFKTDTELLLNDCELKDGDVIVVNQMGSGNTIFRSSNEFLFSE